jgi:lipid A 3-O-deacylase
MSGGSAWARRLAAALTVSMLCGFGGAEAAEELRGPLGLVGDEPSYADLAIGAFDLIGGDPGRQHTTPMLRGELRYGEKLWYVGPAAGILVNAQGGTMLYGGFYSDAKFGRIVVTPFLGIGAYRKGGGENLGGVLEFRLSLEAAYEFDGGARLGVQFAHISNAGIHQYNPSDNELLLTYAVPLAF